MKKIILASGSPRRKRILKELNIPFKVIPSRIKEKFVRRPKSPVNEAKRLASQKARDVAKQLSGDFLVIGADTVVVAADNEVLGKPVTEKDAVRILKKLSGTTHRVITAVSIIDTNTKKEIVGAEISKVKARRLTDREIRLLSKKHLDKAGGYAVQEENDRFIEKIEGSFSNAVGLPKEKLLKMLKQFV